MKLTDTLKILACAAAFLLFFPLVMFLDGLSDISGMTWLADIALIEVFGFLGFFIRMALTILEYKNTVLARILLALSGAAAAVGAFFVFSLNTERSGYYSAALAAVSLTVFILGAKFYYCDYAYIMKPAGFITGAAAAPLSIFSLYISGHPYSTELLIFVFFFPAVIFALISSQNNIDNMMERRHHSASHMPPKIRSYNIRLIIIISGIAAFLFIFRKGITAIFAFLGRMIYNVFSLSLKAAEYISRLTGGNADPIEIEQTEEMPEMSEYIQPEVVSHPVLNSLFYLVGIAVIIFLIVRFRHDIANAFRDIFRKIAKAFTQLSAARSAKKADNEKKGYTDTEDITEKETELDIGDIPRRKQIAEWKKLVREYKKSPPSPEKYRLGFKAAINGFRISGTDIPVTDTVYEIADIDGITLNYEGYLKTADIYSAVRYGEKNDPDFSELNKIIEKLSGCIILK